MKPMSEPAHGAAADGRSQASPDRVVITGIGCITPFGMGLDALWSGVTSGRSKVRQIDRFDVSGYQCPVAGQVDLVAADHLPSRLIKRTDRFTHLAMVAARRSLEDAGVSIGRQVSGDRIGLMIGNVIGGWEFAERELRALWTDGPKSVSPYQATAWFPAAPQGNISIDLQIKGPARTFVADRASGAYALIAAAEALLRGRADVVLAGGVEAPLSPYGWLCLETSGMMAKYREGQAPEETFRPFDSAHSGTVFAEGSTFLVLERAADAARRGAVVRGELAGWATSTDAYMPYYTVDPSGRVLGSAIRTAIQRSETSTNSVGGVLAHASAIPVEDVTEGYALHEVFGARASNVPVSAPKALFGHLMGAAAPTDVALAARSLETGLLPAVPQLERTAPGLHLNIVAGESQPVGGDGKHLVVVSRGLGGVNASLVVRRAP